MLRTIFAVTITAAGPQAIVNQAQVDDGDTHYTFSEITIANGFRVYLPVIFKGYEEGD